VLFSLAGCREGAKKEFLVVEFKADTPLEYKLVSEREITLELQTSDPKMAGRNKPQTMSEKLELIMLYEALEVDAYGLTTIRGTCKSAKVTRKSFSGKSAKLDAAEHLTGESFEIGLTPAGRISDYSSLTKVVQKVGEMAFDEKTVRRGRIKNDDMLHDFIAMQWYLWDSVSTIEEPLDGVEVGQSWTANQLIPLPLPVKLVRATTYTYEGAEETDEGRKATIGSSYVLGEGTLENWPKPYAGGYSLRGMFAFLGNYKFENLEGSGKQVFNIDRGVVETDRQEYKLTISAAFPLALGDTTPCLTIDQKISVELLNK
jgi:hypothetical protein